MKKESSKTKEVEGAEPQDAMISAKVARLSIASFASAVIQCNDECRRLIQNHVLSISDPQKVAEFLLNLGLIVSLDVEKRDDLRKYLEEELNDTLLFYYADKIIQILHLDNAVEATIVLK